MGSLLFFALLLVGCGPGALSYQLFKQEWSMLILTHHWPQTFCYMEHCETDVDYWSLHGLWPNKGFTCNSTWHFNASLIEDLMPLMRKWWPDLLNPTDSAATGFWKHEWMKHGTCAAQAETMNSEHKYFSKALELYSRLNLDGTLKSHNIVPSETYYSLDEIERAINSSYHVKPKIQCVQPATGEQMQILGQLEICFDSEFNLVDCHRSGGSISLPSQPNGSTGYRVCDPAIKIYYPPIKKRHTKHHMGGFFKAGL
ncbi:ribonuclease T2 [Conger conger]|uniref:ribonuclease T2 n=1 Tax=Conger conger TaxID=82655 RepID=UPI002A5A3AE6|nr:ribonuclease T2 [Conger conger]